MSSTSTGSLQSATHAQRLSFVGTLVRVLEPPVKEGVNQVRMLYPEFEEDRYTILEVSIGKKSE
jgi:hypothetical protein